jgi:hypothetical protein
VGNDELVIGIVLVVALVGLAGFYAWRQVRTLRRPGAAVDPATPEGKYLKAQVRRRLIGSALMLVLAAQLAGALIFLEERAQRQAERADARAEARQRGIFAQPTAEERSFAGFYGAYLVAFLVVLLAIVALAFSDLLATRRYAVRAHRELRAQHHDLLEREIARLRQEKHQRNGHG